MERCFGFRFGGSGLGFNREGFSRVHSLRWLTSASVGCLFSFYIKLVPPTFNHRPHPAPQPNTLSTWSWKLPPLHNALPGVIGVPFIAFLYGLYGVYGVQAPQCRVQVNPKPTPGPPVSPNPKPRTRADGLGSLP